jgi:hypothetical protein
MHVSRWVGGYDQRDGEERRDTTTAAARCLLRLGDHGDARRHRGHLLGSPLLRLRRIPGTDAAGVGLVPDSPNRSLLPGFVGLGPGRTPGGALAGPAWSSRSDDARLDGRNDPASGVGIRRESRRILPRLGRHGPCDGGDPLRARFHSNSEVVRARARPGVAPGDPRGRFSEHYLPSALRLADWSTRLARSTPDARRGVGSVHDSPPRARPAAEARGLGTPSRWR